MISADDIYAVVQRKPFAPVRVRMRDGRVFDIHNRRLIVVGIDFLDLGTQAIGFDDGVWQTGERVSIEEVQSIEPIAAVVAI